MRVVLCCLASLASGSNAGDIDFNPFGIDSCHTNSTSAQANMRWVPQFAAIGITNQRTPHTTWSAVEPAEGKFNFETLDVQIAYLESQKFAFGGIFAGNPKWNKKDAKGGLFRHIRPGRTAR